SALMESLEGKRGIPRIRPPFPAVVGLWGGPTVINNAETLASVPHIILGGAEWFANLGTPKNGGTRLFCLSGHVERPGVYELPMGYNLKKMIYDAGGGLRKDINHKDYLSENMLGRTFCPLGDAAAMPTMAFIKKFRKEFEDQLEGRPCPSEEQRAIEQLPVMV